MCTEMNANKYSILTIYKSTHMSTQLYYGDTNAALYNVLKMMKYVYTLYVYTCRASYTIMAIGCKYNYTVFYTTIYA